MTDPAFERLQLLIDRQARSTLTPGVALAVSLGSSHGSMAGHRWIGSTGKIKDSFFIASTSKIYGTALVLNRLESGQLRLNQTLSDFFSESEISGLSRFDSKDYSSAITIEQLLSHTSGLADYFQGKMGREDSLLDQLTIGKDRSWNLQEVLESSKQIGALFPPGRPGRAHYSDTNFQLLEAILKRVTGKSFAELVQTDIAAKLGLLQTYVYRDPEDMTPMELNYREKPLPIRKAMSSMGMDGGIVSTADESLKFIESFFGGVFFEKNRIPSLLKWNRIFFPLQYGIGISRFKVPWFFSPFKNFPEIIGHSGLSGAFQFYCPKLDLYMAGTVNQVASPALSFRMMMKVMLELEPLCKNRSLHP